MTNTQATVQSVCVNNYGTKLRLKQFVAQSVHLLAHLFTMLYRAILSILNSSINSTSV